MPGRGSLHHRGEYVLMVSILDSQVSRVLLPGPLRHSAFRKLPGRRSARAFLKLLGYTGLITEFSSAHRNYTFRVGRRELSATKQDYGQSSVLAGKARTLSSVDGPEGPSIIGRFSSATEIYPRLPLTHSINTCYYVRLLIPAG